MQADRRLTRKILLRCIGFREVLVLADDLTYASKALKCLTLIATEFYISRLVLRIVDGDFADKIRNRRRGPVLMQEKKDAERFRLIESTLYTPVIGDVLDTLGYSHQFLPQAIQPLTPDMRIAGRALPVQIADAWGKQEFPFGRMTDALDSILPHEIYLATGGSINCAAWGEIMTAAARVRKGAGAVIDGFHRDTRRVLEQDWPVFSRGSYAQDAAVRAKVIDFRCSVEIGSVHVSPGDLIVGDMDGIIVIPRKVEDEVLALAVEKATGERVVRKAIEAGMLSTKAFSKYGIL